MSSREPVASITNLGERNKRQNNRPRAPSQPKSNALNKYQYSRRPSGQRDNRRRRDRRYGYPYRSRYPYYYNKYPYYYNEYYPNYLDYIDPYSLPLSTFTPLKWFYKYPYYYYYYGYPYNRWYRIYRPINGSNIIYMTPNNNNLSKLI